MKTIKVCAMSVLSVMLVSLFCVNAYADDKSNVNPVDRMFMCPYSASLDLASDFTQYTAILTPTIFLLAAPSHDWPKLGLLYAGSIAASLGTGEIMKYAIHRDRPYMYYDDPPQKFIDNNDYRMSFPSNHSIMAFTGAGFTAAVFAIHYPDSPYRVPAVAAAYGLAVTTAALRVGSGSHFLSDVTVGALIGTISGFAVPYANFKLSKKGVTCSASANQLSFRVSY